MKIRSRGVVLSTLLLAAALPLSGCIETAVGAGAVAGTSAMQDRGIKGAAYDTGIRAEINHAWLEKDHKMWMSLNLQVYEGRVLVSGTVPNEDMRADAVELAWKPKNVREVINEVQVTAEGGVVNYARDTAISTELNGRLLFAKNVQSVNYSTEVVNGTIYLLGVAQTQSELDRVVDIARNISNVKRVVSHVILKDDPRRFAPPGGSGGTTPTSGT
jgi:osmotically-inducible protein OsmY